FALCGMDELVNQAAKNRFMFGGQGRVPMVVRMPIGIWDASAAQHSQSLEAWFAHLPGVVVLAPSTPQDNSALLRAALACGVVLLAAGAVAGGSAVAAKWLVVGRIRAVEYPLWSSFVWRNEVSDTFVETVAAPWFARAASGTPVMNLWLRALGAKIGRGVWCETYWLPEADLVTLERGSTVNRGCVVQTHLFHDRIMRMDTVVLEDGATLGPHCVALPAARIGGSATVGPASLVMRGDEVPPSTRWQGNPIAPWTDSAKKPRTEGTRRETRGTAA
ncbi:MAG TPA: hypothetical protein PK594_13830, partial [Mycobacterium sp.]|nr:hypothetical protein [Mycobacterium sp.]